MFHRPEPHILLFRRPRNTDPLTGMPPNYKVLTVQMSAAGEHVEASCFSIAGEKVAHLNMLAKDGTQRLREQIGSALDFPPENLQLVLPNGDSLPAAAGLIKP